VNRLAAGLSPADLDMPARVLGEFRTRLEAARGKQQDQERDDHEW